MNLVCDTNILIALMLPGLRTPEAKQLLDLAGEWYAPPLWRSEFRNVLAGHLRRGILKAAAAVEVMGQAEAMMAGREPEPRSRDVLQLVAASSCSAYDCEYVAVARMLGVPLVTEDRQVVKDFPDIAISLANALAKLAPTG